MTVSEKHPARSRTRVRPSSNEGCSIKPVTDYKDASIDLRPPRQPRSEKSLAKMVHAGWDLIEQHGDFNSVVVSEVIRAAGTSKGAFYGRFKDKDAFIASVLEAVFVQIRANVDKRIDEDLPSTGTPTDVVACIVRIYFEMCRQNRGVFKAVLRHFAVHDPASNPIRVLDLYIRGRVVPVLSERLQDQSRTVEEFQIQAVFQIMVGTLAITLLTDPGPLRFEGKLLETNLQAMMNRFLQLS